MTDNRRRKLMYRPGGDKIFLNPNAVRRFAVIGYSLEDIRKAWFLKEETFAEYCRRYPKVIEAYNIGVAMR